VFACVSPNLHVGVLKFVPIASLTLSNSRGILEFFEADFDKTDMLN